MEKIFANDMTDKGLIFKIHEHLIQLNIKKKKIKKWAEDLRYRWPTGTWKDAQHC